MMLALGHLLNEVGCPALIKKFPSLHELRAHLAESFKHQEFINQVAKSVSAASFRSVLRKDGRIPAEDHDLLSQVLGDVLDEAETIVPPEHGAAELTPIDPEKDWEARNEAFFPLRASIVLLYGIAATIVAFFSVRQFWIVWGVTF